MLLARAEKEGAQLIIGPLQKNKVEQLVGQPRFRAGIGMNQLDGQPAADNLAISHCRKQKPHRSHKKIHDGRPASVATVTVQRLMVNVPRPNLTITGNL